MRLLLVLASMPLCVAMAQQPTVPTFQSGVTIIQAPVVVRDGDGRAVDDLRKQDFQLFDNGKPVEITGFSAAKPGSLHAPDRSLPESNSANPVLPPLAMDVPERFLAFVFDDTSIGDGATLQRVRDAAAKQIGASQPGDRIAIITTSCAIDQDFTNERARLLEALSRLQLAAAPSCRVSRAQIAQLEVLKGVVKRMANLPGQHVVLLISPGFQIGYNRSGEFIDAAANAEVIVHALDTGAVGGVGRMMGDPSRGRPFGVVRAPNPQLLDDFARGTGGQHVTGNDFEVNFRKLSTPESYYVLGFVSEAKADGAFHRLKVSLAKKGRFTVEARAGYYAR